MKDKPETKSTRIYDGKVVNLRIDAFHLPDGREAKMEIVEHVDVVHILPVNDDGNLSIGEAVPGSGGDGAIGNTSRRHRARARVSRPPPSANSGRRQAIGPKTSGCSARSTALPASARNSTTSSWPLASPTTRLSPTRTRISPLFPLRFPRPWTW